MKTLSKNGGKEMTRTGLKIVTIGGGSSYTPELIEGYIMRKDQLPIKEIWLILKKDATS